MINFAITLTKTDASNLIGVLQDQADAADSKFREYAASADKTKSRTDIANRDWYEGHREYWKSLIQKIISGYAPV